MFATTVALVVTAALSFSFSSTRRIGLLCIALLVFLYPHLAVLLLSIGLATAVFIYTRKKS